MTMRHVADKQLRQRTAAWPRKSPSHVGARTPSLLKRWDACEDTGQIRAAPGCSGQHLCFGYDQPQCRTPWAEEVTPVELEPVELEPPFRLSKRLSLKGGSCF